MSSEDLRYPSMVHRTLAACDLEVALVDNEPSLPIPYPIYPDHSAVYLVQGVGTESVAYPLAEDCLHGLEQPLESAGFGAVEGDCGNQLSAHPPRLAADKLADISGGRRTSECSAGARFEVLAGHGPRLPARLLGPLGPACRRPRPG